jgi:hypothetical protein
LGKNLTITSNTINGNFDLLNSQVVDFIFNNTVSNGSNINIDNFTYVNSDIDNCNCNTFKISNTNSSGYLDIDNITVYS